VNKIVGFSYYLAASSITYNLVDQGVANTLALETLRHGTNVINNVKIRLTGGLPSKSCDPSGSTFNTPFYSNDLNNKRCFFLFKDSEYSTTYDCDNIIGKIIIKQFEIFYLINVHTILSSTNMLGIHHKISSVDYDQYPNIFKPQSVLAAYISPTLRFRFSHIDPSRLENDPNYDGKAYRTEQVVESWRLGLVGSILTGVNSDIISRAEKNPLKVATGIAQLTIGICLAKKLMKNAPKTALIPVALGCLLG
jgi:hypothetical protein